MRAGIQVIEMKHSVRPTRSRIERQPVHGVLLLDKPWGMSSNQALQKVKWLLRAKKAGHTGTLDPLATGVLPICLGAATKFSSLHLDADKSYDARLKLGVQTETGDAEGAVLASMDVPTLQGPDLQAVQARFMGEIQQLPPMYSALKKDGKPLYAYARAGIEVERPQRNVHIHALQLDFADGRPDELQMQVTCSKGTYIRTLAEDVAQALGTVAHLLALRRTASMPFEQAQCLTLEQLEDMDEAARLACLLSPQALLPEHQQLELPESEAGRFLTGLRRRGNWTDSEQVAVFGAVPRAFLGTAHIRAQELIAKRLLSPLEIKEILLQQSRFGFQDLKT